MENILKRRRYKDNSYLLIIKNNKYYIKFDNNVVEVTKEVFDVYDEFERHDIKELNEHTGKIF